MHIFETCGSLNVLMCIMAHPQLCSEQTPIRKLFLWHIRIIVTLVSAYKQSYSPLGIHFPTTDCSSICPGFQETPLITRMLFLCKKKQNPSMVVRSERIICKRFQRHYCFGQLRCILDSVTRVAYGFRFAYKLNAGQRQSFLCCRFRSIESLSKPFWFMLAFGCRSSRIFLPSSLSMIHVSSCVFTVIILFV